MRIEKIHFYVKNIIKDVVPRSLYRTRLRPLLSNINDAELEYIQKRVNYYNKLDKLFTLDETAVECRNLSVWGHPSTYYYDFMDSARYFYGSKKFNYFFGDIRRIPEKPTFLKARPISDDNKNSVILKLNKVRHFNFYKDKTPFEKKLDMAVFRGACYQEARKVLLEKFASSPLTDIIDTGRYKDKPRSRSGLMSEVDQMKYKFIISIEGNDVATNLKWIMHSNSLCFMRKPQRESWFMENLLVPDYHYVLLKDDFSDLEEKISYYAEHTNEAKDIINNANNYVSQFLNETREKVISVLVMNKYFELSGQ